MTVQGHRRATRTLKRLGVTLVLSLASIAVTSSTASAFPEFHAESENTTLTGTQTGPHEWGFDVGKVNCPEAKFIGAMGLKTSMWTSFTPAFEQCKLNGLTSVLFTHNGCDFRFHAGFNTGHFTGTLNFDCPEGKSMEFHAGLCRITIPEQIDLPSVTYSSGGSGTTRDATFKIEVSGVDYVEHGITCHSPGEKTLHGTYSGGITVTGENQASGAHRAFWVE